jgi:nucleoside-diphosphate-sugar epimerase
VPTALVTGATGLIGMHLVPRLQRDGWDVRALVRDPARAGLLSRADVTLATGDVLDETSFTRAARGCDALFHAAAVITPLGGWEAFRRPNVEGTRNAIAAARSASARLVHVSSVAVYGDHRYAAGGERTDESKTGGRIAEDSYYARSKRESEDLVFAA